jgi:hypothetical protein
MSQLISTASSNGGSTTYDTKIPDLTEAANIVKAFMLYHYGTDTNNIGPQSPSIHTHLTTLQNNINAVLAKVSYTSSAPSTPETGRLWVDSDTGEMYVYSGTAWILVSASGSGAGTSTDSFFLMGA